MPYVYKDYPVFISAHPGVSALVLVLVLWTLFWKGAALWKAGQKGQLGWFVVLFLVNTLGILEILYIYLFSKKALDRNT